MRKRYSPNKISALLDTLMYLVSNVSSVKFYFQNCLCNKSPLDLELPWIALEAIKYLDGYLLPDHKVYEYGGGGSTLYFVKKVKYVETLENNLLWKDLIEKKAKSQNKTNLKISHINYDPNNIDSFFSSNFSRGSRGRKWSVIMVDNKEIEKL